MKRWLKTWFALDRVERNGLTIVVGALFLTQVVLLARKEYLRSTMVPNIPVVLMQSEPDPERGTFERAQTAELSPFDPDTLSAEGWVALGFSDKQSRTIINFRNSIGGFQEAATLERCFVIDQEFMDRVGPLMVFPKHDVSRRMNPEERAPKLKPRVDIGSATQEELMSIKGVGPVLSKRIVSYRDLLSGFYSVDQLQEVYGIDKEAFEKIKPQVEVLTVPRPVLDPTTMGVRELASHPYISTQLAARLVELTAHVRDCESLMDSLNFAPNVRQRFGYYLQFNGPCR